MALSLPSMSGHDTTGTWYSTPPRGYRGRYYLGDSHYGCLNKQI